MIVEEKEPKIDMRSGRKLQNDNQPGKKLFQNENQTISKKKSVNANLLQHGLHIRRQDNVFDFRFKVNSKPRTNPQTKKVCEKANPDGFYKAPINRFGFRIRENSISTNDQTKRTDLTKVFPNVNAEKRQDKWNLHTQFRNFEAGLNINLSETTPDSGVACSSQVSRKSSKYLAVSKTGLPRKSLQLYQSNFKLERLFCNQQSQDIINQNAQLFTDPDISDKNVRGSNIKQKASRSVKDLVSTQFKAESGKSMSNVSLETAETEKKIKENLSQKKKLRRRSKQSSSSDNKLLQRKDQNPEHQNENALECCNLQPSSRDENSSRLMSKKTNQDMRDVSSNITNVNSENLSTCSLVSANLEETAGEETPSK